MEQFTAPLAPLIDAEKFACVLAQFPYSFHAWTGKPPPDPGLHEQPLAGPGGWHRPAVEDADGKTREFELLSGAVAAEDRAGGWM